MGTVISYIVGFFNCCNWTAGYIWEENKHANKLQVITWKVEKDVMKIIRNKNADATASKELEAHQKDKALALTNRRRVFGSYAIVQNSRAEFIQYTQTYSIPLSDKTIEYFNKLRRLHNVNIVKFYGIQVNDRSLGTMTFFHSLVERSTLQEFCSDVTFDFTETFKSAFMRDILRGLEFIHHNVGYHGLLHASTCLIDVNWVLKLSLFGISNFISEHLDAENIMAGDKDDPVVLPNQYVCFPPEHIRQYDPTGTKPPRVIRGSQKGDIYCMGMILYTMAVRYNDPFEVLNKNVIPRVSIPALVLEILEENRMPEMVEKTGEDELETLLLAKCVQCWDRDPSKRPTINDLLRTVADTYPHARGTLIDQMVRMDERAAEDLEMKVLEATSGLAEAEAATMRLLNEMMPPDVAKKLKNGIIDAPESYASATVMFVQICDFIRILKTSTPNEVIYFLNDVFNGFDEVIETHDAYKVETTGETYMVASGVPKENGGRHVVEIAEMSLKIREFSYHYVLERQPDYKLSLRIGFHAGPIAAGVIGIRAPRYCLFGDTVNFASRMQSNCPPNQIQTSERTANMLDRNEYKLVKRGIVHVKGKGEVNCFWLNEHVHHNTEELEETPILDLPGRNQPGPSRMWDPLTEGKTV